MQIQEEHDLMLPVVDGDDWDIRVKKDSGFIPPREGG
jgi:hypothetical protein